MKKAGIVSIVIIVLVSVYALIVIFIGNINYTQTIGTDYNKISETEFEVQTDWGIFRTETDWINIATQPTCPGFVGILWSKDGLMDYEYGMFAPDFMDSSYNFTIENKTFSYIPEYKTKPKIIDGLTLHLIEGEGTFGIHVPAQNDMAWGFTIYPSEVGWSKKDELIRLAVKTKFLKKDGE